MQQPLQVAIFIIGTIVVVFGAYYTTYYIGHKASGQRKSRIRNRNINMVDRFAISKDKSFCLVEIAGKVYVVGITNQSMTLLDTLDAEALAETAAERRDDRREAWPAAGKQLGGRLINRLSCFLAEKMGAARVSRENAGPGNRAFSDIMKTAHDKNRSGHQAGTQAERLDDPEGEQ